MLGGGNALGAYHLGVCEELLAELSPDRIVGTSIGAITGAILAGNPPETRLDQLRAFWRQARRPGPPPGWGWSELRARESVLAGLGALLGGRPGLFHGGLTALWPQFVPGQPARGLNDHRPMARTLESCIDFDRLRRADPELHIVALDMESGREVWFDSRRDRIGPEHLLACGALPPLFPAVELDGRLLCDAGLVDNTPVARAFELEQGRPFLCVAVDLFPLEHGRPSGLNGTVARAQDLAFAGQTRRAIEAVGRERAMLRRLDPELAARRPRPPRLPRPRSPACAEVAGLFAGVHRRAHRTRPAGCRAFAGTLLRAGLGRSLRGDRARPDPPDDAARAGRDGVSSVPRQPQPLSRPGAATTPSSNSAPISRSGSASTSARISSVCWPSAGAGTGGWRGWAEKSSGEPGTG